MTLEHIDRMRAWCEAVRITMLRTFCGAAFAAAARPMSGATVLVFALSAASHKFLRLCYSLNFIEMTTVANMRKDKLPLLKQADEALPDCAVISVEL